MSAAAASSRIDWVDYAKGICILLVVMFHTVNHYEAAVGDEGWMRWIVDFSKPFRMQPTSGITPTSSAKNGCNAV